MRRRRTARLRLTLWYGGLVFATGVCLLLLNFFLVERSLTSDAEHLRTAVQRRVAQQAVVEPSAGQPFQGFLRDLNQLSGPMFTTAQASLVKEALSRLMLQSALALPVVTLFSLGVGWVMAGRTLRPLSEITATAQRLSEANLHERI
ncbi:MAG TPA: hypothetical protein VML96_01350, partial [Egibacteraceae bacterium]|nr:hypothetical protein [Egibacteraceae bacterium]